jgi:outer membrane protein assembly factor BamB
MKKPRWWPAFVILALGAASLVHAWLIRDSSRQERVLQTVQTTALAVVALLLWMLFASRLPRRVRLATLGGVVALGLLGRALFRIRGVTGDVVPILELRWARDDAPALPGLRAEDQAPAQAAGAAEPAPPLRGQADPKPEAPGPSPANGGAAPRVAAVPAFTHVGDYPQFLGPRRDGTLPDLHLARDFAVHPPRRLWRQRIGAGWSAFAVAGRLAVTQEQRGNEEYVVAYDLATGSPRWSHRDQTRYATVIAGVGPRATPTIVDGRVYTMGGTGILNALDLSTGRRLWTHQVVEEAGARLPDWGKSCSPLVAGGRLVVSAGGADGRSLVAYDAGTGTRAWSGGNDRSSYASPVLATIAGRSQVLMFNQGSVSGHDPETGAVLWEQGFPSEQPNVAQPVPLPRDRVLLSAGYGIGAKLYEIAAKGEGGFEARVVWESPRLKSKFANMVVHGGFVFGFDDGVLTCLDPESGERRWKGGRYGHGQILLVGDLLLVQTEEGEVVLVEAAPDAHREIARFRILDGKTWNTPALAGSVLLVRNDQEAAAYELALAEVTKAASAGAQ